MKNNKKPLLLIGLGSVNLIHGLLHLLQFIQSILLVSASVQSKESESIFSTILHSPIFSLVWAVIGLVTLYIGIKDFKHHKDCHDEH